MIQKWFQKKEEAEGKQLFTEEWITDWKEAIDSSKQYAADGKFWNASIVLAFNPVPEHLEKKNSVGFYLDLQGGRCDELRFATEKDKNLADVVLTAGEENWRKLISKKKDPTMEIMKGGLKLEKGSLVLLSTQRKAAKTLLATAPSYSVQPNRAMEPGEGNTIDNMPDRNGYVTTGRGLDFESKPMKLFQKAKKLGTWDPFDIDFSKDREQWSAFTEREKMIIIHLSAMFMAGEEAVTADLLPLISVVAKEKRIEEEIFLTSFLWEEAKHTEFFARFVNEVISGKPDFESFHDPLYKVLFYEKLPNALHALWTDDSPRAQLTASITYNMIVEGTLAETGYAAYSKMLEENDLLPGLRQGIELLKRDESRHIAFGLYFINRILDDNPKLRSFAEDEIEVLLNDATNIIHEIFERYGDDVPFGLDKEWFLDYAIRQFQYRMDALGMR